MYIGLYSILFWPVLHSKAVSTYNIQEVTMSNNKSNVKQWCYGCRVDVPLTRFEMKRNNQRYKMCMTCRNKHICTHSGCGRKCSSATALVRHFMAKHENVRDFECFQCGYACSAKQTLELHIKNKHNNIRDFQCDLCDKAYTTGGNLQKHIDRVHNNIRDFQCTLCPYTSASASGLKMHFKQRHTDIRDHACDRCDYTSACAGNLKTHLKTCGKVSNVSSGELAIMNALDSMNIKYITEASRIKTEKGRLRFDFEINYQGDTFYVEYNGKQHYEPVQFGGVSIEKARAVFEKQQRYDQIKKTWCEDFCTPLLSIKYTDFANIPQLLVDFMTEHTFWDGTDSSAVVGVSS